jgi:hypothetical protein
MERQLFSRMEKHDFERAKKDGAYSHACIETDEAFLERVLSSRSTEAWKSGRLTFRWIHAIHGRVHACTRGAEKVD